MSAPYDIKPPAAPAAVAACTYQPVSIPGGDSRLSPERVTLSRRDASASPRFRQWHHSRTAETQWVRTERQHKANFAISVHSPGPKQYRIEIFEDLPGHSPTSIRNT